MAREPDLRDMMSFIEQIDALKRENRALKLKLEIEALEREINTMTTALETVDLTGSQCSSAHSLPVAPQSSSTPYVQTCAPNINDVGAGISEDETHLAWDRFVTKRPHVSQPTVVEPKTVSDYNRLHVTKEPKVYMKPATFDGSGSWLDYKAHFEACAEINGWNMKQKGLYLAVSLRGQAQGVFGNLTADKQEYEQLSKALEERFAPPNQTELYRAQLRDRHQRASETLAEMDQDIRRLTNLAYPSAPADVRETLAKEQFIDSLISPDMRLRIKQARPTNLNEAVRHAVELEAFHRAERTSADSQGYLRSINPADTDLAGKTKAELESLKQTIEDMKKEFSSMRDSRNSRQHGGKNHQQQSQKKEHFSKKNDNHQNDHRNDVKELICYECGKKGHIRRHCRKRDRNSNKANFQDQGAQKVNSLNTLGAGLYVKAKINGVEANCLVDTGATLTVVSTKLLQSSSHTSTLESFKQDVVTASGSPLDVEGKTSVVIVLNGHKSLTNVIVSNIDVDAILGLNYMKEQHIVVDVANEIITIGQQTIHLNCVGPIGIQRVGSCYMLANRKKTRKHRQKLKRMQKAKSQVLSGEKTKEGNETDTETQLAHINNSKDNVSCIFRMATTTTTVRKLTVTTVCPLCKVAVKGEDFTQHVLACTSSRLRCSECGLTFLKSTYLNQHKKRAHIGSSGEALLKQSEKEEKVDESESSSNKGEGSDWDSDPEIFLEDNNEKISKEEESNAVTPVETVESADDTATDSRKVVDLTSGRIIRKRTMPDPVLAPVKCKKIFTDLDVVLDPVLTSGEDKKVFTGGKVSSDKDEPEIDGNNNVTETMSIIHEANPCYSMISEQCSVEVQTEQVCEARSKGDGSVQVRETEDDVFGKHVANELRLITSTKAKRYAKFHIQKLLFEAQEATD